MNYRLFLNWHKLLDPKCWQVQSKILKIVHVLISGFSSCIEFCVTSFQLKSMETQCNKKTVTRRCTLSQRGSRAVFLCRRYIWQYSAIISTWKIWMTRKIRTILWVGLIDIMNQTAFIWSMTLCEGKSNIFLLNFDAMIHAISQFCPEGSRHWSPHLFKSKRNSCWDRARSTYNFDQYTTPSVKICLQLWK